MPKAEDLTGQKFGYWTVLWEAESDKHGATKWHCKCQCGKEKDVYQSSLKRGLSKSCGCIKMNNLTGRHFGQLTVLYPTNIRSRTSVVWHCLCSCGNETNVAADHLKDGSTISCGCSKVKDLTNQKFGRLTVLYATDKRTCDRKILWHCRCDCGNEIETDTSSLLLGRSQSCGCLVSKGEEIISKALRELNIEYKQQYSFSNCRNPKTGHALYFDFYLPRYNCCIEYDGKQHFIATGCDWNTQEHLEDTHYRDTVKNKYCQENRISLIRIPYTDFNRLNKNYILSKLKEVVDDTTLFPA